MNAVRWIGSISLMLFASQAFSQAISYANRHPLDRSDSPPGMVSMNRIMQTGHAVHQYQVVRFEGPKGTRIALSGGGDFLPTEVGPIAASLLVGPAYRIKVTDIPYQEGLELFPTVELLDRLCPPPGLEVAFPVPIVFTQEDLETAAAGGMVTRVVYLEDPQAALPIADKPGTQRHFDVEGIEDPMHVADELGKPIAIVRIGSRVAPNRPELMPEFLLGSPPWLPIMTAQPIQESQAGVVPISYGETGRNGFAVPAAGQPNQMVPTPDRMSPRR